MQHESVVNDESKTPVKSPVAEEKLPVEVKEEEEEEEEEEEGAAADEELGGAMSPALAIAYGYECGLGVATLVFLSLSKGKDSYALADMLGVYGAFFLALVALTSVAKDRYIISEGQALAHAVTAGAVAAGAAEWESHSPVWFIGAAVVGCGLHVHAAATHTAGGSYAAAVGALARKVAVAMLCTGAAVTASKQPVLLAVAVYAAAASLIDRWLRRPGGPGSRGDGGIDIGSRGDGGGEIGSRGGGGSDIGSRGDGGVPGGSEAPATIEHSDEDETAAAMREPPAHWLWRALVGADGGRVYRLEAAHMALGMVGTHLAPGLVACAYSGYRLESCHASAVAGGSLTEAAALATGFVYVVLARVLGPACAGSAKGLTLRRKVSGVLALLYAALMVLDAAAHARQTGGLAPEHCASTAWDALVRVTWLGVAPAAPGGVHCARAAAFDWNRLAVAATHFLGFGVHAHLAMPGPGGALSSTAALPAALVRYAALFFFSAVLRAQPLLVVLAELLLLGAVRDAGAALLRPLLAATAAPEAAAAARASAEARRVVRPFAHPLALLIAVVCVVVSLPSLLVTSPQLEGESALAERTALVNVAAVVAGTGLSALLVRLATPTVLRCYVHVIATRAGVSELARAAGVLALVVGAGAIWRTPLPSVASEAIVCAVVLTVAGVLREWSMSVPELAASRQAASSAQRAVLACLAFAALLFAVGVGFALWLSSPWVHRAALHAVAHLGTAVRALSAAAAAGGAALLYRWGAPRPPGYLPSAGEPPRAPWVGHAAALPQERGRFHDFLAATNARLYAHDAAAQARVHAVRAGDGADGNGPSGGGGTGSGDGGCGARTWALQLPGLYPLWQFARPDCLRFILETRFSSFGRTNDYTPFYNDELMGRGIANVDGKEWAGKRKAAAPLFSHAMMARAADSWRAHLAPLCNRVASSAAAAAAGGDGGGGGFDVQELVFRFTMDTTSDVVFGQPTCDTADEAVCALTSAFERAQALSMQRWFRFPLYFLLARGADWDPQERELAECLHTLDEYVYRMVARAKRAVDASDLAGTGDSKFRDLLTATIRAKRQSAAAAAAAAAAPDAQGADAPPADEAALDREIRDLALTYMIAGRDTVAAHLSWSLYELCAHPAEAARVVAEVDGAGADEGEVTSLDARLPVTRRFLAEVMRLHPSVPYNSRFALEDMTFPDGTRVRRGDSCAWSSYAQGRSAAIWGPDAAEFRPDRHATPPATATYRAAKDTASRTAVGPDAEFAQGGVSAWCMPVTNGGPRICLGRTLARYEGLFLFSALLRRFAFAAAPDPLGPVPLHDFGIMLKKKGGVWVTARERA